MKMNYSSKFKLIILFSTAILLMAAISSVSAFELKRQVMPKPVYDKLPAGLNTEVIVIKLSEGMGQPELINNQFQRTGAEWDKLNSLIFSADKKASTDRHFTVEKETLDQMRAKGMANVGISLPDLSLYYDFHLSPNLTEQERIDKLNEINSLGIIEVSYFPPVPEVAVTKNENNEFVISEVEQPTMSPQATPNWQADQHYLNPAPTGVDAYYAWQFPGGKGENIKVIDIEGNWNEAHEDLHGGTDNFHISGSKIGGFDGDDGWINHGTAVLGEIAADSNGFGMTGISFNCDLGTVAIGSMSTAQAITTCVNNSDTGDVFLIELHAAGPNHDPDLGGQNGYVCMEYWQANFDAILTASSLKRIVVEAAGNGAENFDDPVYGSLFDPSYRFSGAIMVGAGCSNHYPASFTNYGQRIDVHGYGCWDIFTLGYGGLYGPSNNEEYTNSFSGTSSASPIITGACAVLQGVSKAHYSRVMDHSEIRHLLTTFSTPQSPSVKNIGPMPDLSGAVEEIIGVALFADTTFGFVPFDVNFTGMSGLAVDNWEWNFGDGSTSSYQNASHTYTVPGEYDVALEINAGGDIRNTNRASYIVALADTMSIADSVSGKPGESVEINIYGKNTIALRSIKIPLEFPGDLSLQLDSFTTNGCRTDYFESINITHFDPGNKRFTIKMESSLAATVPDLAPGSGLLAKIYMTIHASAVPTQSATLEIDGYPGYTPEYHSAAHSISFAAAAANSGIMELSGCCNGLRGNWDNDVDDLTDIADILFMVDFSFASPAGPAPECFEEADVDGSGQINITDILLMVDYAFFNPPLQTPASCY